MWLEVFRIFRYSLQRSSNSVRNSTESKSRKARKVLKTPMLALSRNRRCSNLDLVFRVWFRSPLRQCV